MNPRFALRTTAGQRIAVEAGGVTIGRDPLNRLVIDDPGVSRQHARVRAVDDTLVIDDLGSSNGTFVNTHRISGTVGAHLGDELRIGPCVLLVEPALVVQHSVSVEHASWPRSNATLVVFSVAGLVLLGLLASLTMPSSTSAPSSPPASQQAASSVSPVSTSVSADWADVFQRVAPDVVVINNATDRGSGTGVYFDDQHVLTNAHVVATARTVQVTLLPASGRGAATNQVATVLARDAQLDLAVLTLAQSATPHVAFGSTQDARVGDEVMAIGEPLGLAWTATFGRVSAFRQGTEFRRPAVETVIQFDASVNPGNSGGPLVTHGGRVIGLVTFGGGSGGAQGLNFAIGGEQLWAQAREWIAGASTR